MPDEPDEMLSTLRRIEARMEEVLRFEPPSAGLLRALDNIARMAARLPQEGTGGQILNEAVAALHAATNGRP